MASQLLPFISILLLFVLAAANTAENDNDQEDSNTVMKLRASVLTGSPPLCDRDATTGEFVGFQIDLLKRIQEFAYELDGITLQVELDEAPLYGYTQMLNSIMDHCNTTDNPVPLEECWTYDFLIGDFYTTADRSLRVEFTPPWLQTSVSALKVDAQYSDEPKVHQYDHVTTLAEADRAQASVCVLDAFGDGFLDAWARSKYQNAHYVKCPSFDDCLAQLKTGNCALFINDELKLRYMAVQDPTLQVTRERANSQFITWPLRTVAGANPETSVDPHTLQQLMNRWMYAAKSNATLDELFDHYFAGAESLCPVGFAAYGSGDDNDDIMSQQLAHDNHVNVMDLVCDQPCDPSHGRSDRFGRCVCDSTKWTGPDCATEVLEDTNGISNSLLVVGYAMVAVNVLAVLICAAWLYVHRGSAQVRVAQPFFLCLVLLGCLISTSTIAVLAQQDNTRTDQDGSDNDLDDVNAACMAIPWLYSVGFSITFGTMFAKIRAVYKLFVSAAEMRQSTVTGGRSSGNRLQAASVQETLLIIGVILALDVAILTAWTVIDPLQWERTVVTQDKYGNPLSSEGVCTSDHWMLFAGLIGCLHFCLLGLACYLCYKARDIPTKFSEGKYLAIAMISNMQIFIVGVPVLIVLGSDPQSSFFVRSVIIWMNDLVVLGLIFGNLMWSVYKDQKDNISDAQAIRSAMEKYTSKNLRRSSVGSAGGISLGGQSSGDSSSKTKDSPSSDQHYQQQRRGSNPQELQKQYNNINMITKSQIGGWSCATLSHLESVAEADGDISNSTLGNSKSTLEQVPEADDETTEEEKDEDFTDEDPEAGMILPPGEKVSLHKIITPANLAKYSKPRNENRGKNNSTLLGSSHSKRSRLVGLSSITLSEIDEDLPFDSAARYSTCSSGDDEMSGMSDQPPVFPRRSRSEDFDGSLSKDLILRVIHDGPPSAPMRYESEHAQDLTESGRDHSDRLPDPMDASGGRGDDEPPLAPRRMSSETFLDTSQSTMLSSSHRLPSTEHLPDPIEEASHESTSSTSDGDDDGKPLLRAENA